jgi:TonB family protein
MTRYRKSADQGYAYAQVNVGWLYHNGWGVKQDYGEAMTWYRKAANQGNAKAQSNIGWLYEKGFGVKQDYTEAIIWYRKAADQGYAKAQTAIGWLYENGWGVKQDYSEALTWYLEAADKGDAQGQNNVGVLYQKGLGAKQDYAQAMAWYYRAADQGHAQAQYNLGLLYRNGLGDKQDYGKALTWFRKAADQGYAKAETSVGWLYENGLGVAQDYAQAMTWYRKASDQGNADGQADLGMLYLNGLGVKQDYGEAMTWFRKAADQNDPGAQNSIGWLYQNGFGFKQDYAEAMTWYRKAAEQGNTRAKANIEWLSRNGWQEDQTHGATQNNRPVAATSEKGDAPRVIMPGGIVAPHPIYEPDPEYSEEARKARFNGVVLLTLVIGSDGLPHDIKVVAPLGDGLDEKAVDAVKKWKFEPGTKDGKPVAVPVMIEVEFRLFGLQVGKVEVVGGPEDVNSGSYLSPIILEAGKCWSKLTEDKMHPPSIKQGQVTIQFVLNKDGRVGATEIASPSGDDLLDHGARDCVSPLKTDASLPAEFKGKDLTVRMQLLYSVGGMSLTPGHAQIAAGAREQFYVEMAGIVSKTADWSVTGAGCTGAACGTISADGLYTAPDALPKPPLIRVKGTLAGANPIAASAVVTLVEKH